MASAKIVTLGPVALTTTTTTNIFNPPTITGGVNPPEIADHTYYVIRHVRVTNKTTGAVRFGLWKDATGGNTAGKEIISGATATAGALDANVGISVAANSAFDWYGLIRLQSDETDEFIVGGASAAGLTIQAEAEMSVV